ncbi:MAG TPA: hypothetical protein VEY30_04370 [Myxococcaceae bacterium]|nr:hypothetical protein [Myxococcaceae bacterium]
MGPKQNVIPLTAAYAVSASRALSKEQKLLRRLARRRDALTGQVETLRDLIEERDRLRDQIGALRDFAERMMGEAEAWQGRVAQLEGALSERGRAVRELEEENEALLEQGMHQARRIAGLEADREVAESASVDALTSAVGRRAHPRERRALP